MTIIILKPNKELYDSPKSFRPIVLLNTLGKLIEEVIGKHLQFQSISKNFIYPSQLGRLKQRSTADAGIALTYFICMGWVRNIATSTLAFDIAQFFPSLNHCLLPHILSKAGFDPKVKHFFSNYLVRRKTQYFQNNFSSSYFNVDVRVGQGSALSSILSALYSAPVLYILERHLKNLKIPVSILSFVDDGLFIAQSKTLTISNLYLFYSYNIASLLLEKFGLIIEFGKMEVFHFSGSYGVFDPPSLDLSILGGPILCPRETWKYIDFIFNRKLLFHQHVNFYANKAILTVKYMKILGNSSCSLVLYQKRLLYRSCILLIALYSFHLWFYNKMLLSYPLDKLRKMQRRVAI